MRAWRTLASSSSILARCTVSVVRVAGPTPQIFCKGVHDSIRQRPQDTQSARRSNNRVFVECRRSFSNTSVLKDRHDESRNAKAKPDVAGKVPQDASAGVDINPDSASPQSDTIISTPSKSSHASTSTSAPPITSSPDPPSSTAELPSESLSRRNHLTVRLQTLSDRLITSLSLASHRVNALTGTDYSAIAALRESISQQERDVKEGHEALSKAREAHNTALATQAASQKEVVQLLERKHSWSATDLERYMSLIRSEHTNEQSVSAAREQLERCEARLESARQTVERAERKQYHEEQIWSDTIRRNSTWVTFGLMGLNILLLIVNLVMIEPWRRKRMVKEIRTALDEKTFAGNTQAAVSSDTKSDTVSGTAETLEDLAQDLELLPGQDGSIDDPQDTAAVLGGAVNAKRIPSDGQDAASEDESLVDGEEKKPRRFRDRVLGTVNSWFSDAWQWANYMLSEEHHVILSRVDLTTALAESWAIGATCMLLLFVTVPIDLSDIFR